MFVALASVQIQQLHLDGRLEEAQRLVDRLEGDPSMVTGQAVVAGHAILCGAPRDAVLDRVERAAMDEGWQELRDVALLFLLAVRIDAPQAYWAQWASMARPFSDDWVAHVVRAALDRDPGADVGRRERLLGLVGPAS